MTAGADSGAATGAAGVSLFDREQTSIAAIDPLCQTAEAVDGRRPSFIGVPYGADMRLLANEGTTPTVDRGTPSSAAAPC
ncbi:MAG TPA: hypothetical protein VMT36_02005 [Candidatus Saccharimonadia bacterium]|nr:hypothetical protein [Candidatus Saccharimonadia bacterium]